MNRFLLLALTAGLLSPIAVKAEGKFTELEVNPYSYQPSSAFRWVKEGENISALRELYNDRFALRKPEFLHLHEIFLGPIT